MSELAANDAAGTRSPLVQRLVNDGFVLEPNLCDRDFLERVLDVSGRRSRAVRDALGDREIGIGSAAGYVEIVQRSPGRWDVPITPRQFGIDDRDMPWWGLVAAVLGEDAEHSFSGVVSSEPGSPAQYWHTDSPHVAREHMPAHALNVLVALHDVPMSMGPTEFARGSHVFTNHLRYPSLVLDRLIYQHAGTSPEMLVEGSGRPSASPSPWPPVHAWCLTTGSCTAGWRTVRARPVMWPTSLTGKKATAKTRTSSRSDLCSTRKPDRLSMENARWIPARLHG